MEPNREASEITLPDGRDWSRALRLDLAFGGELANSHPPGKASINCMLLVMLHAEQGDRRPICQCDRLTKYLEGGVRRVLVEFGSGGLFAGKSHAQN
jgi:hypothetical protein